MPIVHKKRDRSIKWICPFKNDAKTSLLRLNLSLIHYRAHRRFTLHITMRIAHRWTHRHYTLQTIENTAQQNNYNDHKKVIQQSAGLRVTITITAASTTFRFLFCHATLLFLIFIIIK